MIVKIYHYDREKDWKHPLKKWEIHIDDHEVVSLIERVLRKVGEK